MLCKHNNSLRLLKIRLDTFSLNRKYLDLSDFTIPKHLIISRLVIGKPLIPITCVLMNYPFAAPNLKNFTWDFTYFTVNSNK